MAGRAEPALHQRSMNAPAHQQQPPRARRRPPRPGLQPKPDELRPQTRTTARPHPTPPPQQHLRPHQRRNPRRRLLHQAQEPAPRTTPRRRQTTRARRDSPRPGNTPPAVNEYVQRARLAPAHRTRHNLTTSREQVERASDGEAGTEDAVPKRFSYPEVRGVNGIGANSALRTDAIGKEP